MNIHKCVIFLNLILGIISEKDGFGYSKVLPRADSTQNMAKKTTYNEQNITPQQYIDFVCEFLRVNGEYPFVIRRNMIEDYNRNITTLKNLAEIFGVKTHPYTQVPTIDVSWPNLRLVIKKILADVLDHGENPKKLGKLNLNYFAADHKNSENPTTLKTSEPITLNHLRWILNEFEPLFKRIEHMQESDEVDGRFSGLSDDQAKWLANLLIVESEERNDYVDNEGVGRLTLNNYVQGKGRLFNTSKLNATLQKEFKDSLIEMLKNKTGFQRAMSLLALHVLNNNLSIDIVLVEEGASYLYTRHSIRLGSLYFDSEALMHESTHAYHQIIGSDPERSKWHSIYSELNASIDLVNEFFPMLSEDRMSNMVNKITEYIEDKTLNKENTTILLEKIICRGFGSLLFDKIPEGKNLKIDKLLNDKKLIAKCLYISAYVLPDNRYMDPDGSLGERKEDILWIEQEEKITMQGHRFFITIDGTYGIEDRQSELLFNIRNDENIHAQVQSKEKYCFHTADVNERAFSRFQSILSDMVSGDHTVFFDNIKPSFNEMDLTPSGNRLNGLNEKVAAYKTQTPSCFKTQPVHIIDARTSLEDYTFEQIETGIKNLEIDAMDVPEDFWRKVINKDELFKLMCKELLQNLSNDSSAFSDKLDSIIELCEKTNRMELLDSCLVEFFNNTNTFLSDKKIVSESIVLSKKRIIPFQLAELMRKYVYKSKLNDFLSKVDNIDELLMLLYNDKKSYKKAITKWRLKQEGSISLKLAKLMRKYVYKNKLNDFLSKVDNIDELLMLLYNDKKSYKKAITKWRLKQEGSISLELAKLMRKYISRPYWNKFIDKVDFEGSSPDDILGVPPKKKRTKLKRKVKQKPIHTACGGDHLLTLA